MAGVSSALAGQDADARELRFGFLARPPLLTMLACPGGVGTTMPVDVQRMPSSSYTQPIEAFGLWRVVENSAIRSIATLLGGDALAAVTSSSAIASARWDAAVLVAWVLVGVSGLLLFPAYIAVTRRMPERRYWTEARSLGTPAPPSCLDKLLAKLRPCCCGSGRCGGGAVTPHDVEGSASPARQERESEAAAGHAPAPAATP